MTYQQLKETLQEDSANDIELMLFALCDGEYLAKIGITDEDEDENIVEDLYNDLKGN
jgi:hypothetical protein